MSKALKNSETAISSLLLGLAVGDALGVPWEFRPRGSFLCDGMSGYGTHNQPPGTWSDDTSLALGLADSLSRGFSPADIARNFVKWYDEAAFTAHGAVFDIGIATTKAISRLKAGIAPEKAGCAGVNENGNGRLMRIAPLVFYLTDKPEEDRFNITRTVSSITHAHPWSVAACCLYLEYLLKLLGGMDKEAAYAGMCGEFRDGSPYISDSTLDKFTGLLRTDIRTLPEPCIRSGGFVIDTLKAALWCFLITDSYRDAVLKTVNLGDDTDTTAAVTGALAGLFYGLDTIPPDWLETLAGSGDIRRLAGAMAAGLAA
ncbi:MAG: ADP-ribosylglycohydrolase family protein [Spirochaetaceae bacterium]|jgi:ADP-ribosylglycohydrolase|nr:ADP-ribosylglycohydrolase family protein [Spirochaetaceae bacterium]